MRGYVLRAGFRDGWRGLVVAAMAAYTDWKKYWRLFRLPRQGRSRPGDPS